VTGVSKGNLYKGGDYIGLVVHGGIDDLFTPGSRGGSFTNVNRTSIDERFVDNYIGIFAIAGRRHADEFGPSKGNEVRVRILSPEFKNNGLRDVEIAGGNTQLGDRPANGNAAGNTIEVTLTCSDFNGAPGRVWIKNHTKQMEGQPVPPMPTEPDFGNRATFTGSRPAFERSNPGVNQGLRRIPAAYFKGGKD
jgi:hypothetical protein